MRPLLLIAALLPVAGAYSPDPASIETLPAERGGQDLVGMPFGTPRFDEVVEGRVPGPEDPKAILYRWWTDTCPYCRSSLPAFESLRRVYGPHGLEVIGVYHPKPARRVNAREAAAEARRLGFRGTVAVDADWSVLDELYLSTGDRRATSAGFLLDREGIIRFVHPGPVLFPSDDPDHARENHDYRLLEQAVRALLEIPLKKRSPE